ncbi:MAG: histidine phosphatase family protein [Acidimicrobiia bacterium]|nr:histidine phosphatase family protein [Acidimicrobiia bacterium]
MSRTITLLRHGQTEANLADLWQGQGDSPLSATGRAQVKSVAQRLSGSHYDLLIASDLGRTRATAAALGRPVELKSEWREADLGTWEGKSKADTHDEHEEFVAALKSGDDPQLGVTGERLGDVAHRIGGALDDLVRRLDDGQRALVVCHGGVIQAAAQLVLGAKHPPTGLINTSLTTIQYDDDTPRLHVFNDVGHLPSEVPNGATEILVIRHGESEGNVAQRWQGRHDAALTETGREQARRLANVELHVSRVVSSPLARAFDTAKAVANSASLDLDVEPDLVEFDFGEWENLTAAEIEQRFPEEWHAFRTVDEDIPRGRTGERFEEGGERFHAVVEALVSAAPGLRTAVVSHGGVSRAYLAKVLGVGFADRYRYSQLRNTAMASFVFRHGVSRMSRWNVAPHLDLR